MKREILDAKVCDLNLPVRVKEVLSCEEIMTVRQLVKRENDALENILRSHIDNPIVGEITKDKLKASGVSGIIRRKELFLPEIEKTDKGISYTLQSDVLGISQGDMLIQFSGARMLLCDIPCEWYEEKFDYTDN
ncbi:MAG: hypothetical protein IJQ20_06490 [Paludibacteraceae bacterium]|nr:hypothetical protein [Paludibacteraceae bacterium]